MNELIIDRCANAKATLVLAHGAGADMRHSFMATISELLLARQINVLRFNFPYMIKRAEDGKRRPPDRMPVLLQRYREVLQQLAGEAPLYIGGKSMGCRVAATLLADATKSLPCDISGLVCFGYPFHPIGKPTQLRLQPLEQLPVSVLILQGQRDKLGAENEIAGYDLPSQCHTVILPDGDHDLKPRKSSGYSYQQHLATATAAIVRFIDEHS